MDVADSFLLGAWLDGLRSIVTEGVREGFARGWKAGQMKLARSGQQGHVDVLLFRQQGHVDVLLFDDESDDDVDEIDAATIARWNDVQERAHRAAVVERDDGEQKAPTRRDPGDVRAILGSAIEAARKQRNWSRAAFARYIGVSYQTAAGWEQGWGAPNNDKLVLLVALFPSILNAVKVLPAGARGRVERRLSKQLATLRKRAAT